jgi:hypothetical protein
MELSSLFVDRIIPVLIAIIALLLVIKFLLNKNKKIKEEILKENERQHFYKNELDSLKKQSIPLKNKLNKINELTRKYYKEHYNLDDKLTYLELAEQLKEKNQQPASKFCEKISELNYSGKSLTEQKINDLIDSLTSITSKDIIDINIE